MSNIMNTILKSALCDTISTPWFTIITCTYNRAHTLPNCYESIKNLALPVNKNGTHEYFEWIIVDDGSNDGTRELVESWIAENKIPIKYTYQNNSGKHTASNKGIKLATGYAILEYDSDDLLLPDALTFFYNAWYGFSEEERRTMKGVTGRCIDSRTGKLLGTRLPYEPLVASPQDMRFKHRIKGEMFGFTLRSIMLQHLYPVYDNSTKFCPESIVIFEIGKKYKEAVFNKCVRVYVTDSNDAITKGTSRNRAPQNYYLWKYEVNNLVSKYILSSPIDMIKAVVGITMDGFRTDRPLRQILSEVENPWMKVLVTVFSPAGFILSKL